LQIDNFSLLFNKVAYFENEKLFLYNGKSESPLTTNCEDLNKEWFPDLENYKLLLTITSMMLFIISFIALYNYRKFFLAIKTLKQLDSCKPHSCLILLLSTPNIVHHDFSFPIEIIDTNFNKVILKGESLRDDINALNSIRWNWQQLLRGIEPHHEYLKYVYLIGSKESFKFFYGVENIIKQYCKQIKKIIKTEKPVNFEDLIELTKIINKGIQQFKELDMDEEDIIIDVTGGQKTTSIAGAVITLNSQVSFQYVQTNEPYKIMAYDVMIQPPISV